MGYFVLPTANITTEGDGKEKGLRGVVVTISFPDKRHRNGKRFFLLQCNSSTASAWQFRGTTLSGHIDVSLSHSHIHRIALRRGSFPKQFPHPSPDRYLVYTHIMRTSSPFHML